jgi:hypothetical protein
MRKATAKEKPMSDGKFDPTALLDADLGSFEAPVPIPTGSYLLQFPDSYEFGKIKNEKETPYARYQMSIVEPLPDVDQEALAASLGQRKLNDIRLDLDVFLTPDSMYRFKELAINAGQNPEGVKPREMLEMLKGAQVVGNVDWRQNKDKTANFAYIKSTAAVPS